MAQLSPEALSRDDAVARAFLIRDAAYTVLLDLTLGDETFTSETTLIFAAQRGSSTWIDLTAVSVAQITLNGKALNPGDHTGYRFPLADLAQSNSLTVRATHLYSRTGAGLHFFSDPIDGKVYLHSQCEAREAHRIFACFDQPDIKARFSFQVLAPADWKVASNTGASAEPCAKGALHTFATTLSMSTYLVAIVAGNYRVVTDRHRDIELGLWVRESLAEHLDAAAIFEVTKQGFDFFNAYFDIPYMWGKYDQLFVPEFNAGAMENPGCVTFSERYVFRSKVTDAAYEGRANTILHEMAHMWFGDLVTMKWWDDLWLNESFATYMGTLAVVEATRFSQHWVRFASAYKAWALRQDQLPTTHPIVADCPDTETARTNFDGISYAKGASSLKQLVAYVGADNFRDGVRLYLKRFSYKNASLADFLSCQEETSGRDLTAWAASWLQTAGVNTLRPELVDDGETYASFRIKQTAPRDWPTIRPHRLRVGLYDLANGSLQRRCQVELDIVGPSTEVQECIGERVADFVLLNDDDLTFAKIRFDSRSLRTANKHLKHLQDPLSRATVWTAAIDQQSEAELSSNDFVSLVLNNIDGESDPGLVAQLLTLAAQAFTVFGQPAHREKARLQLATTSHSAMLAAVPGGDLQLVWANTFVAHSRSSEHVGLVRALLDGKPEVPGLKVDTDLRWSLVEILCEVGAQDADALVRAELQRDPSDQGKRHAATARAAIPTREAKAASWRVIVDPASTLQTVRAAIEGFWRFGQEPAYAGFDAQYFEALAPMWQRGPVETAVAFCAAAFPLPMVGSELVARVDDYLAKHPDTPPPYVRYLRERQDLMRRVLKAREL